jgi:probable HAF family extracellular repeat protein
MKTRYQITVAILAAMLLIAVLLGTLLWPRPKAKPLYKVTILPTLGGLWTMPSGINNRGQIVGYSEAAGGGCHLCLWDPNGRIQDLGPNIRTRFHLNDSEQIAGTTRDPNGHDIAFLWDRARGMRLLGTLGGYGSTPLGLNNRGQVVGWSWTATGLLHAFVWDESTGMRDLSPSEADHGEARAINDSGLILGTSDRETSRPALWTSAGPVADANQLRDLYGFYGINRHGYTAGRQRLPDGREFLVLWRPGSTPQRLLPLDPQIVPWSAINDANQILFTEWHHRVFESITTGWLLSHPLENYLWDPNHGCIPLNPQVLTNKSESLHLSALNDRGCIVGWVVGGTYVQPILLEPIPERWGK